MSLKPISSKAPIPFKSSIFITHLCTCSSPTPSQSHHGFHSCRRLNQEEEDPKNVKVSVWWDFENCNLPIGVNAYKVAHSITSAIRANDIKGPIQITAFGDVAQLSRPNQEALSSTGVNLSHIPNGGKNSADRSLLVDLMYWVSQNPPPAHLFLISGDRDFAGVLHKLRMNNYNVLLASHTAPSVLCSAASIMWRWNALVRGENITGKVYNQPPDGPYGSWYGHYKVPLEDPFLFDQATPLQGEELSEASSETKVRPIPKAVVKQIRDILSLYPKGIPINELRIELRKRNVEFDKDFYGYEKFSRFLLSMPNILKLRANGNGQFVARGIIAKPEPFEPNPSISTRPVYGDGNQRAAKSINPMGEDRPVSASVDQKSSIPSSPELTEESVRKLRQSLPSVEKTVKIDTEQPPKEMRESRLIDEKNSEMINAHVARENRPPVKGQENVFEVGFFRKMWRGWFGSIDDNSGIKGSDNPHASHTSQTISGKKSENTLEKCGTPNDSLEKKENQKFVKSRDPENCPIPSTSCSLSNVESALGKETTVSLEPYSKKLEKSRGFVNLIKKLIWGNGENSMSLADKPSVVLEHLNSFSGMHEMFCDDSFWRDMESFLVSQRGSLLVSQSRTREQMAKNLQKDGPLALGSLNESNMLQLVDKLISEKRWVEELPSEALPFKLTLSAGKDTALGVSSALNGLRSIFLKAQLQSDSKRQPESDLDGRMGRILNASHAGDSQPVSCEKTLERSGEDTLIDCQDLVKEVVKEFPEGFNIGCFRKLFLERYGYHLDISKLGHQKLASLLRIMPGVKIESTYMFPSSKAPKCSIRDSDIPNIPESNGSCASAAVGGELSDAPKDDESDSTWDELGPVESSVPRRNEQEEEFSHPHYEPSLSDDEFSDSEGEPSSVIPEEQAKCRVNTEHSSLLEILHEWYSTKDGVNGKEKSENVQDIFHCVKKCSLPSDSSGLGTKSGTSFGNYGLKKTPKKSYSFVAVPDGDDPDNNDSHANNPDELIDGIIGSLKKTGETRMQS